MLRQIIWQKIGRILLWVLFGLLLVRGAADILVPRRQAEAPLHPAPPIWVDRQAYETQALLFTRDYLTWRVDKPAERLERLRGWVSGGLISRFQFELDSTTRDQTVIGAWVYSSQRLSETEAQVVVVSQVSDASSSESPNPRWVWLSIPVARLGESLSVVDLPTRLPAPSAANLDRPASGGAEIPDSNGEVRDLVDSFLRAYAAGTPAQLRYFLAPGVTLTGLGGASEYTGLVELKVLRSDTGTVAVAEAVLTDQVSQAHLHQRFVLRLVRQQERWLIQDMEERGN